MQIKGFGGQDRNNRSCWKALRGNPEIKRWHWNGNRSRPRNDGLVVLRDGEAILVASLVLSESEPTRWVLENKSGWLEVTPWWDWVEIELSKRLVSETGGMNAFTADHSVGNGTFIPGIEVVESKNGCEAVFGNFNEGDEEDDRPWISYFGKETRPTKVAFTRIGDVWVMVDPTQPLTSNICMRIVTKFQEDCYRQQSPGQGDPQCLVYGHTTVVGARGVASDALWVIKSNEMVGINGGVPGPRGTARFFGIMNTGTQVKGV